ncbi:MAG: hypothetical protein PPFGHCPK_01327 [Spiroplasma endosymbiont of Drosophila atripex]|nr:MAG: hypothetical protein PPFGHCPK_00029 [Spiroplasma endosymbiont of Drosophila atripex]WDA53872.1 MAG: hypothetical protein PPFGHCPK_00286 [Spiroplasma endosymbiont of Drosophila atripex]WDA54618.1 MAG: hypothetical protein PPFGHCPK_01074 [Spiroplasma endosymbiont of Drosophila atripex]WDA54846.1 MAG: hypothetical protein PPFGHCPK_01327 [Spiroplasma endosymbiont of Drosophila atripex]
MIKLKDLFGQDKIEIFSPNPKDLTDSNDIKAIILWKYPNAIAEYLVVSQPHANTAILVGDNVHYTGWVEVLIKPKNEGVNENAKWHHCTIK